MKKADLGAILILVALPALILLPFLIGPFEFFPFHSAHLEPWAKTFPELKTSEPANGIVSDKQYLLYPDLVYTSSQMRQGRAPLWNPHNFAGLPHQANPITATAYPFTALATFMDPMKAIAVISFLHIALAGLFSFFYLRSIKLRASAALAGGLAFAFSGWMAVHIQNYCLVTTMVWLPLALLAIERVLRRRPRWALMILALSIAMMFLAGFPQTAVINCWFILAYALVGLLRLGRRDGIEVFIRRSGFLAAFAILGLALASIQLVPTMEFMSKAGHQNRSAEDLKADSLRPISLLHLVVPDFFGHPSETEFQPGQDKKATDDLFCLWLLADGQSRLTIPNNYSERSFYVGILALLLALAAPFLRRNRPTLTLAGALIGSLLLACGTPLTTLAAQLPGLDFGSPMRYVQIAGFVLPCLFAVTLDHLMALSAEGASKLRKPILAFIVLVLLLGLPTLVALRFFPESSARVFTDFLRDHGVDRLIGTAEIPIETQYKMAEDGPIADLSNRLGLAFGSLTLALLLLYSFSRWHSRRWFYVGVLVLVLAELGWHGYRFNRPVHSESMWAPTPGIEFLMQHRDEGRFIRWDPALSASFFTPNAPLAYGLNDAQGYRALAPKSFLQFMQTLEPNSYDAGYPNLGKLRSLNSPQLDLLRVRYLVAREFIENCPWPQVYPAWNHEGPVDMFIFENEDILPRANIVHEVQVMPKEDATVEFAKLVPGTRSFDGVVWLEELYEGMRSSYPKPSRPEKALVVDDRPGHIGFELDLEVDGLLVLSEQYGKGWRALVKRKGEAKPQERKILRANTTFMAIPVQTGDVSVEFLYEPESIKWAGLISGFALILLMLVPLVRPLETPSIVVRHLAADGSETSQVIKGEEN